MRVRGHCNFSFRHVPVREEMGKETVAVVCWYTCNTRSDTDQLMCICSVSLFDFSTRHRIVARPSC